jgi:chromosome segregation ATPase
MVDAKQNNIKKFYRSPIKKLVTFFETSRNKWKEKCRNAKKDNKLLKSKIRYLEKKQNDFKTKIDELNNELTVMKNKTSSLEKELKDQKKRQL